MWKKQELIVQKFGKASQLKLVLHKNSKELYHFTWLAVRMCIDFLRSKIGDVTNVCSTLPLYLDFQKQNGTQIILLCEAHYLNQKKISFMFLIE